MTNEEKAREIGNLCPSCLNDGINGCSECERSGKYFGALQMAEWKDQQFKEYLERKKEEIVEIEPDCDADNFASAERIDLINEIINELFKEE